jgi:hypothetical protein
MQVVELSNMVFSIIFSAEMVLKLAAYGLVKYVSDGFNVFDGFIVILRYCRPFVSIEFICVFFYSVCYPIVS